MTIHWSIHERWHRPVSFTFYQDERYCNCYFTVYPTVKYRLSYKSSNDFCTPRDFASSAYFASRL